ncbi:lysylphosphatidylglycerol synthase domain-containing protein [Aureibaculum sp. 2210JD6-5]|uniref:lysylphosphatidylglycerol synthase domain-containing protein n=1 Tax=Aureibaculum sp. 2210JD6-5 TaxID=3103957 RepID=UPI002AAC74FB|nr:lysylphosphatidylglycerol synthase domain-containing protein [Aureibaculum sp. 2210JD6-5]MDY7395869.1 lysylphosphatidylglycerol synthase domain-containing protein [Aureibaculum sp. 2210JD6-5]
MPNKTKQFFFFLIKLAIVVGAFYFIYNKTIHNEQLSFTDFFSRLEKSIFESYKTIFILIGFTILNWFFEVLKWKTLVSSIKNISFFDAFRQSLGSLTASLFTPNRIGEYGAKAIYFKKGNRRKIMLLNLIGNMSQMAVTVVLGLIGLIYVLSNFQLDVDFYRFRKAGYIIAIIILILIGGSIKGFKKIRGFYIDKIIRFVKKMPTSLHLKIVLLSFLRYIIFSHQFYFLLMVFGVEINYLTSICLITSMYFLASIVPSLALLDWLVKGSVAIWIFSLVGVNELIIVTISLLMWILNFGIPAVVGSYFVLNFNFSQQK